jgi:hypothetical protein
LIVGGFYFYEDRKKLRNTISAWQGLMVILSRNLTPHPDLYKTLLCPRPYVVQNFPLLILFLDSQHISPFHNSISPQAIPFF